MEQVEYKYHCDMCKKELNIKEYYNNTSNIKLEALNPMKIYTIDKRQRHVFPSGSQTYKKTQQDH